MEVTALPLSLWPELREGRLFALGGAVVTVEADLDGVERRLAAGELWCPTCGSAVLAGWGWARSRQVRGPDGPAQLCPRRSRCTGCGVTHVLLPVSALLRRADAAAVIVSALVAKARCGLGFRRIAAVLGRPGETVRGWLRRFAERAESVRSVFTVWLRAVDPDPVMPDAAGGVFADAVTVMAAVGAVIARRFALPTVSLAEAAVAMSGGRLLAPGWPDRRVQHESTLP
ncbi:hypothetical protein MLAC_16730 [Mycobacterium lacus]|uniref:Uncharacterized protein n=1 Tax=Mycobacterium lacus TaxID=169765 RepID=A0A7I7NJB4_9MYCO|nr:hypothetical protein MLAC_16730 [Mycobacterium lacus]